MSESETLLILAFIPGLIALVLVGVAAWKRSLPDLALAVVAIIASVFLVAASRQVD